MNKEENPPLPTQRAYRKQYEAFFAPLGRKIANFGISADFISYLNLLFSFFTAVAFYYSSANNYVFIYVAIIMLTIASFFDMIDGSVARATKEKYPDREFKKFGAVLDPAIDRYSEALIVLGIMLSGYVPADWVLFTFVGMIMASYVRARAESLGMTNCSVGIERKEKITLLAMGATIQAVMIQLTQNNIFDFSSFYFKYPSFIGDFLIGPLALFTLLVGILSHISTYQRLMLAKKHL
jgi:phosphatidylglycerophosphate synthase